MKKYLLPAGAVAACFTLLSAPALAAKGFEYTYVNAGYRNVDGDSISGDGALIDFSFGATDLIHVDGSYSRMMIDEAAGASDVDLDADTFKFGIGGHFSVSDNIDVLATVRYVDVQMTGKAIVSPSITPGNFNFDDEGLEVDAGARIMFGKKVEVAPRVLYQDVGGEDDTGFGVNVLYKLDRTFMLNGGVSYFSDDDETDFFAGIRINL